MLIEARADVNAADGDGMTPLEHRSGHGDDEIARSLRRPARRS
jgi:ankyrin repeat protein